MMRIITGSARGAKLIAPAGEHTRPTAERTKEAVFSMLQYEFTGRRVLDLFAGSGQLGLEAISRGAESAVLVDSDRAAIDVITKNAAHTRLADRAKICRAEAESFLRSYSGAPFHLIFLDPPYKTDLVEKSLSLIVARGLLATGGIVVCETATPETVFGKNETLASHLTVLRRSRYGVAHICLLTPCATREVET